VRTQEKLTIFYIKRILKEAEESAVCGGKQLHFKVNQLNLRTGTKDLKKVVKSGVINPYFFNRNKEIYIQIKIGMTVYGFRRGILVVIQIKYLG
jgi:ribosomal protein S25